MGDKIDEFNAAFKLGRDAGQADVCLQILKYDPSFAWEIAKEYLARLPGYESAVDGKQET